jgi:hypothetical protein
VQGLPKSCKGLAVQHTGIARGLWRCAESGDALVMHMDGWQGSKPEDEAAELQRLGSCCMLLHPVLARLGERAGAAVFLASKEGRKNQ